MKNADIFVIDFQESISSILFLNAIMELAKIFSEFLQHYSILRTQSVIVSENLCILYISYQLTLYLI